jgi:hypothetical protein
MTSAHDALDQAARLQAHRGGQIRHLQRIFAPEESRCLCLFESSGTGVYGPVLTPRTFLWPTSWR